MLEISLSKIDLSVILIYFILVLVIGFWYRKKSSKSLESYFLGNKTIPWWALATSGSVSNFDITGTMWIVSILYLLGMKAFWVFWMFAFLTSAFLMSYMGKWIRRTNVMTAVELMKVRFGGGYGGRFARTAAAVMASVFLTFCIGYSFRGVGKFATIYLPFTPNQCAIGIMGVTTIYVVLGGFTSVIITDVIQAVILNIAGIVISILAFLYVDPVILNEKFSMSLLPVSRIPEVAETNYSSYEMFGILCVVWVMNGVLQSLGGCGGNYGEQRFLATRNPREAAKAGAGWGVLLIIRWAMIAGITFLAISNQNKFSDIEQVLPVVLKDYIPVGIRGFIVAGLLAAFMSSFSSILNSGASIIIRDIVQPLVPQKNEKTMVALSYLATIAILLTGFGIGSQANSINQIWMWMIIGLNASLLVPNALRWYWWRMNGWGYAVGTLSGMLISIIVLFNPNTPIYIYGPLINIVALLGCILGSLFTPPIEKETILEFYNKVQPKGFWRPIKELSCPGLKEQTGETGNSNIMILNVIVASIGLFSFNIFPIYLIGHWYRNSIVAVSIAIFASVILYFTWYRKLSDN